MSHDKDIGRAQHEPLFIVMWWRKLFALNSNKKKQQEQILNFKKKRALIFFFAFFYFMFLFGVLKHNPNIFKLMEDGPVKEIVLGLGVVPASNCYPDSPQLD